MTMTSDLYLPRDSSQLGRSLFRRVTPSWHRRPCASFTQEACPRRERGPCMAENDHITSDRKGFDAPDSHFSSGRNRAPADIKFPLTRGATNQVDGTTWAWAKTGEGTWPGVGRHEICSDPRRRRFHARECTLNAVGMVAGVPPHTLLDQGQKSPSGLGQSSDLWESLQLPLRSQSEKPCMISSKMAIDISRHCFTVFEFGVLDDRVLRRMEVMDDGNGGHTTGTFEIDHRKTLAGQRRPGGFDVGEDVYVAPILFFHSVVRGKISSCHRYTFELPEKIQLLADFKEWTNSLRTQGVTVESFVSGWKDALSIARKLYKVIANDTLPPCALCNGAEERKYRFPDAYATTGLSNVVSSLQDPIGRVSGLTVLDGLLGGLAITSSLGSQVIDGPVETRDGGYDEANHPDSENGWARLSDSRPVRSAGRDNPTPIIRCDDSVCFCEGMGDYRPHVYGPEERPPTENDLRGEWHRKHPREEHHYKGQ